ncbi:hypothetical protein GCM10022409_48490 [Hymenobacter glaciei]|uniref:N-acetyltransferase domain-containing protein n=1 Tax=Hymenobacter glaciei TaxID=877209 RepID=A0ABP7UYA3_9BACT
MKTETALFIQPSAPDAPEVGPLLDALSADLGARFGSDGRASFTEWQPADARYIFLVARTGSKAVGCGAVRPLAAGVGEVKRIFAKYPRQGIGAAVLRALEAAAQAAGYYELLLETRVANAEACQFYAKNGYRRRANYGQYIGRDDSACFSKTLPSSAVANSQQLIQEYIEAYNRFDVAGMLAPLHENVVFRNVSNGEVNLTTTGKDNFRRQAEQATQYFSEREQRVTNWQVNDQRVEVAIDYTAVAAIEFPNGLKPGNALQMQGKSVFEIENGQIISIEDII